MSDTRIRRVEEIFLGATQVESSQWKQFLDDRCEGDADLRAEVESLLQSHRSDDRFLDSDDAPGKVIANKLTSPPVEDDEPPLPIGYQIGAYKVTGILGRGGMGIVYLAQQERPRRTVAMKVMRRGVTSERLLRRFEYEAEVLGRLQHPGIAQIYEAGVWRDPDRGWHRRPFIAMELVRGKPLTDYADEQKLGTRDRLDLLARVCDAVQHAHQMGVIHRDLKPGNIFVDGQGNPKILDFGVARASTDSQMTTIHTAVGQLIGTLQYMSPEQVVSSPDDIDTRSDVYAMGVILFELLAGKTPYEVKNKPLPEVARMISHDAPARLSSIDRTLRGDIETIAQRALEKDRDRRYQTAADLATDIRRFLQGLPIAARDDSSWYLLSAYVRRNKAVAGVAAAALLAIISAGVVAILQGSAAERARLVAESESANARLAIDKLREEKARADQAAARADASAGELARQLRDSTIERGRLLGVTGNLPAAEDAIWPEFFADPASPMSKWALWEMYSREPLLRTFGPPTTVSRAVRFIPGTHDVFVAYDEGTLGVYDAQTAIERWILPKAHAKEVTYAVLAERGDLAISGSIDGDLQVRRLSDGGLVLRTRVSAGRIDCLATAFDDRLVFVSGAQARVDVYDLLTGLFVRSYDVLPRSAVVGMSVSPDRRWLAAGLANGSSCLWDLTTGECTGEFSGHSDVVQRVEFSLDSKKLVTGGRDRRCIIREVPLGRVVANIDTRNGTLRALRMNADRQTMTVGGWWSTQVYDLTTGRLVSSIAAGICDADYADDGSLLVTAGFGVKTWELAANRCRTTLRPSTGAVSAVAFGPDDSMIASASYDQGDITFWDRPSLRELGTVKGHASRVRSLSFSPDGQLLASGSLDGTVKVWNVRSRRLERTLQARGPLNGVAFLADSRRIVGAGRAAYIGVWDAATGKLVEEIPTEGEETTNISLSADRGLMATVDRWPHLAVFDLGTLKRIRKEPTEVACWSVALNPVGSAVALGTWSPSLQFLALGNASPFAVRTEHQSLISTMMFGPDGRTLITGAADGTMRLWDASTGQPLCTFAPHEGSVFTMAFSHSGRWFASGGGDGALNIWDLTYYDRHIAGNQEFRKVKMAKPLPRVPEGYRRR